jgi:hypothetical protein
MGKRLERAQSKALLSSSLAATGGAIAGPFGAGAGAITGLIIGDETIVFPMDMVAIPAFEYASLTMGQRASFMIYIKEGEVLRQVQETDAMVAERALEEDEAKAVVDSATKPKRKKTKYQRTYKKHFDKVASSHKNKNGKWKKGGFKRAVKAAHAATKKELNK